MIIICDGVVNAGDLELAEPEMLLNDDASVATYSMQDKYDSSGNARDLVTENEFTKRGMITVADAAHGADTGIIETDEMTFALCININKPDVSGRLFSNFYPGVAPFSGIQLRIEPNGALILQIATGDVTNGHTGTLALTSVENGGAVGGWTRFTVTVSKTEASITRAGGNRRSAPITKRNKSTRPIILNGSPSPEQNMGLPGIMGAFAVYNRVLTAEEQAEKRDMLKTIMSLRGEFVN
ncbi:LamG-like jellyroll fold domain-containing protein [Serratia marcescens]|uniref:LamG-like jellyroll fold domain-containing protein n=2 Tax=Serratia marcescens TaxID=615 RepID=A0ABD5BLS5_SERMA|nr:LamG-like jellyroll fold domain-containing protein [Serratia marcescens]MDQ9379194.1 LamG-like jellyroll fold domain-containing protein [Serratia marcescens]MDQ9401489.1 LamG-like jellyroll fold domain-containing protein [Serratia marcescens]MDQ9526410.1 LamG-like jellyroll fold domain-containing protein [Serratia marcescens]MDQ9534368.1 LamG-like jellyroll fold domain-containing protein [Serratia marcescens]MDQ9557221.1 LamG-like jellyroll fold domain-containing protein [Serratia marcescen